jgi:hypothetical protein
MQWWGPANSLEFIDEPDALTIRATSIRRPGDLIWPAGCLVASLATLYFGAPAGWPISLAAMAALLCAGWFNTSVVELRVTQREISMRSIRNWLDNEVKIQWKEIRALEYRVGGEYQSRGLYARKSFWSAPCIMPQLKKEETQQVIAAIARKFPDIVLADGASLSI